MSRSRHVRWIGLRGFVKLSFTLRMMINPIYLFFEGLVEFWIKKNNKKSERIHPSRKVDSLSEKGLMVQKSEFLYTHLFDSSFPLQKVRVRWIKL